MLQFPPDLTFAVEIVSFAVFLFLMNRWFFRPVSAVLERRRERCAGALSEAERLREEARSTEVLVRAELDEAKRQALSECAAIRQDGEEREMALVDEARRRAEERLQGVRGEVASEMAAASRDVPEEARKLAEWIVARVLAEDRE